MYAMLSMSLPRTFSLIKLCIMAMTRYLLVLKCINLHCTVLSSLKSMGALKLNVCGILLVYN